MFKRCKVVLLPTNKAENALIKAVHLSYYGNRYFTKEYLNSIDSQAFHLYILSDDEIKEGDWIINSNTNNIAQYTGHGSMEYWQKIIATTDSSLNLPEPKLFDNNVWWTGRDSIMYFPSLSDAHTYWRNHRMPSPSPSFIEKYVIEYNHGNIITDVMVEYAKHEDWNDPARDALLPYYPKVNPKDNTITIKKIKDSWTREEVIELIRRFVRMDKATEDKWIKDNL